jgi:succinylglutamate desuccinylase
MIEKFAIYPFSNNEPRSIEQINTVGLLGAQAILYSTSKSTTFSYHSKANFNAHSFTIELGKVHPFGQNPREKFEQTKENLIKLLNDTLKVPSELLSDLKIFEVHHSIIKETDEFDFYFPDSTQNFTLFKKGEKIYRENNRDYVCDCDVRVVFPNKKVVNGQRAALLVKERSEL